jgi:hypothetical protein
MPTDDLPNRETEPESAELVVTSETTPTPDDVEKSEALPDANDELTVFARTPDEMRAAQEKTISWARTRLEEARRDHFDAEASLVVARKNKWRSEGFKRLVNDHRRRFEFYDKMVTALEAGYVIVPNFPVDIFAIRTTKKKPVAGETENWWARHAQHSDRPPLGAGAYVDASPAIVREKVPDVDKYGKEAVKHRSWAEAFLPIDFPIKMVRPQILDATAKALTLKLFDEVGVLPERRSNGPDPMIIGQIVYKPGTYRERRVSFLVAWWLTERDLQV